MQTARSVGLESKGLQSKVEQLCEKMEAVVGMWWTLDGDTLRAAVTVTKQPRGAPAFPEAFVAESCKRHFLPGDSSAVSRVFTTKQQVWIPVAKSDTSYLRKDLAAQTNIASIGLVHMDGGVFEYAFEEPREKPPVLYLSGEPLDEECEDADEGVIRWSQKKNSVLLSPAERKRRRLESNRAAAKRAYYRRQTQSETMQQQMSKLQLQLDDERTKVAVYEALLLRLGVNPAGALAAINGQANATVTINTPQNELGMGKAHAEQQPVHAVQRVPGELKGQHRPSLSASASCPSLLRNATSVGFFNQQPAGTYTVPQPDAQRALTELAERQEQELLLLEQHHRLQLDLSDEAPNNSSSEPFLTAAGPPLSVSQWTEDVDALESPDDYDDYCSAPE